MLVTHTEDPPGLPVTWSGDYTVGTRLRVLPPNSFRFGANGHQILLVVIMIKSLLTNYLSAPLRPVPALWGGESNGGGAAATASEMPWHIKLYEIRLRDLLF
jgi:hypothetical protein